MFDTVDFNRLFWKDKGFVKAFWDWKVGARAATDTDILYKAIAGKQLAAKAAAAAVAALYGVALPGAS